MIDNDLNFDLGDFQAIICAGLSNINYIERNLEHSKFVNVLSTIRLIKIKNEKYFLVYLSSVSVFNGRKSSTKSGFSLPYK